MIEAVALLERVKSNEMLSSTLGQALDQASVEVADCEGHNALCLYESRVVRLDPSLLKTSPANQMAFLVFELFNASKADQIQSIVEEEKSVDRLVERIERLEHESALATQEVMSKIFGAGVEFDLRYVSKDFSRFYALEQMTGHAHWIADAFLPAEVYEGTLPYDPTIIGEMGCKYLRALLYFDVRPGRESKRNYMNVYRNLRQGALNNKALEKAVKCAESIFNKA